MESVDDMAKMHKGANLKSETLCSRLLIPDNIMTAAWEHYSILLERYNDPRITTYFQNNGASAVRAGLPVTANTYDNASLPNIQEEDPVYWMRASEVDFLRAEGVLAGFNMGGGSAKDFYESGIRKSLRSVR